MSCRLQRFRVILDPPKIMRMSWQKETHRPVVKYIVDRVHQNIREDNDTCEIETFVGVILLCGEGGVR